MGIGGISIWQLLIILAIVILLFGTKKLKNIGGDLGGALKGFKNAMKESENEKDNTTEKLEKADDKDSSVIEGESTREKEKS